MKNRYGSQVCQTLSNFQNRILFYRREMGLVGLQSQPLRNILLTYQQYLVTNHNLRCFIDGRGNLYPSFFVPILTLLIPKIHLFLSKFCQNLYKPFQDMKISEKWPFYLIKLQKTGGNYVSEQRRNLLE